MANDMIEASGGVFAGMVFGLGVTVAFAFFCSTIGRVLARRHQQELQARLDKLPNGDAATTKRLPVGASVQTLELVTGSAVFAADYLQQLLAMIRLLIGGSIPAYERLITVTRREALVRLREEAQRRGADYVMNIRFETSRVSLRSNPGCIEILAFGTALRFADGVVHSTKFLHQEGEA